MGKTFLHYLKFLLGIDKPETQTSINEQNLIKKYAAQSVNAVEIGIYEGYNSRLIAEMIRGTLYGIDPFFANGFFKTSYQEKIATKYVADKKNVVFIKKLSWDALNDIPEGVDFIFVDGDHSFEGVKKDFEIFSKKLSQNGVLLFHDARQYEGGLPKSDWGPVRLVNEIIRNNGNWQITDEADSLVVIKKR